MHILENPSVCTAFREYLLARFLEAPSEMKRLLVQSRTAMGLFRTAAFVDFRNALSRVSKAA